MSATKDDDHGGDNGDGVWLFIHGASGEPVVERLEMHGGDDISVIREAVASELKLSDDRYVCLQADLRELKDGSTVASCGLASGQSLLALVLRKEWWPRKLLSYDSSDRRYTNSMHASRNPWETPTRSPWEMLQEGTETFWCTFPTDGPSFCVFRVDQPVQFDGLRLRAEEYRNYGHLARSLRIEVSRDLDGPWELVGEFHTEQRGDWQHFSFEAAPGEPTLPTFWRLSKGPAHDNGYCEIAEIDFHCA